jgi:tetratricopeptide (TPR) repeat protein
MIISVKLIKNSKENVRKLAIALAATWVAWLSQSLISIDNIGVAIWGWILGGSILALYRTEIYQQQNLSSPAKSGMTIEIFQPIASILILIPVVVIVFFLHRQETDLFIAKNAFLQQPAIKDIVDKYSTKVLENPLSDPYYKFEAAAMIGQLGNSEVAKKEIDNLYLLDKRNLVYLNWLVRYEINSENFSQALVIANEIAKYDPHNAKNYLLIGQLYKTLGDEANMKIAKEKVLNLARDNEIGKQAEQELN